MMTRGESKVRLLGGEVGGKTKLLGDGVCQGRSRGKLHLALFSEVRCVDEAYISCPAAAFSAIFAVARYLCRYISSDQLFTHRATWSYHLRNTHWIPTRAASHRTDLSLAFAAAETLCTVLFKPNAKPKADMQAL